MTKSRVPEEVFLPGYADVGLSEVKPYGRFVFVREQMPDEEARGQLAVIRRGTHTIRGEVTAVSDDVAKEGELGPEDNVIFQEFAGGRWSFKTERVLIMEVEKIFLKLG